MSAAGEQQRFDQRPFAQAFTHPKTGLGGSATGADRHALARAQVAPDGRVDQPFFLADVAADQHQIALFGRAALHLALQRGRGGQRASDDQKARGVFVETMDDTRAQIALVVAQLWKARQQAVDQRATRVAWRGMDDDARGLVDDHHRGVLEDDLERHFILGREIELARNVHDLDEIAAGQTMARLAGLAVEPHRVETNQTLPLRPRKLGLASVVLEEGVQALARRKWRDDDDALSRLHLPHAWSPRSPSA